MRNIVLITYVARVTAQPALVKTYEDQIAHFACAV